MRVVTLVNRTTSTMTQQLLPMPHRLRQTSSAFGLIFNTQLHIRIYSCEGHPAPSCVLVIRSVHAVKNLKCNKQTSCEGTCFQGFIVHDAIAACTHTALFHVLARAALLVVVLVQAGAFHDFFSCGKFQERHWFCMTSQCCAFTWRPFTYMYSHSKTLTAVAWRKS